MFKHTLALVGLSLITLSANAALYDRGNGLIYDDVLNITWLQDANYAYTSGYAAANAVGSPHSGSTNIQADGRMGWGAAKTWADQLSYGGYDDWRLASAGNSPTYGYDVTTGELGHMFYNNLGNTAATSILGNVSFTDATLGGGTQSFVNVQSDAYWLGEEYAPDIGHALAFNTNNGHQHTNGKWYSHYSWAVRAGDVSSVPVPAAAWLFGTALLGLAGVKRKHC
ncbi:MAG: VPLPA-CTERM sorting domain-containing protein [Oceanicoccus sp.]|uniref:VPLPA-CTERM sorting domain-containing protein n=1 Tax=Oceanicoccus sp. TaxID=2691044 RepID=UPI0026348871|nr:VPLPA-CTERM sorting domain-containing protein [Oceanicoccus sp.]MDG1773237.1 VPLPA-CTERM sorting domain-containing protein [Oceanicoccus sp.]